MMALNSDSGNVVGLRRGVTRLRLGARNHPRTRQMLGVAQEISRELGFEMLGNRLGAGSDGKTSPALPRSADTRFNR